MSVEEMTYGQYLDMKAAEKAYNEDFVNVVIHSIIPYLKDPNEAYDMPYGTEVLNRPFMLGEDITAVGLYSHLVYLIESYKNRLRDEDIIYEFTHKGEKYQVNDRGIKALAGMAFTVGEVVEVLQYQKVYADMEKAVNNDNKLHNKGGIFDMDCAMEFKLGLQEMAVLARREGEKLPVMKREKDVFITERIKIFEDLPMSIVLDIRFFLLSGLAKLAVTQIMPFTFWERSESVKTKPKKKQSQRANKKPPKRSR